MTSTETTPTASFCFNCGGSRNDFYFFRIESLVRSGAPLKVGADGQWSPGPCVYCEYEAYLKWRWPTR